MHRDMSRSVRKADLTGEGCLTGEGVTFRLPSPRRESLCRPIDDAHAISAWLECNAEIRVV